jgi:cytochrome c-type biogenesis protein CcmE
MPPARKQRLIFILGLITGVAIAMTLALFALKQNINLFFTPTQVIHGQAPKSHVFRIGGIVEKGSVRYFANNSAVKFILSDKTADVAIYYTGLLPTLFREGQGIIAEGKLNSHGIFMADQVLAKHDENYMPPEIKNSLS